MKKGELTWGEVDVLMRVLRWRAVSGLDPSRKDVKPWWGVARREIDGMIARGLLVEREGRRGGQTAKLLEARLGPGGVGGSVSKSTQTENPATP